MFDPKSRNQKMTLNFAIQLALVLYSNICVVNAMFTSANSTTADGRRLQQIQWGEMFDGLGSSNVHYNCSNNGLPICCGVMSNYGSSNSIHTGPPSKPHHGAHEIFQCKTEKVYSPSAYELRHHEIAVRIQSIPDENGRREAMVDEMILDIPHANEWLQRVYLHMQTTPPSDSPVDETYLSKFLVNQTCHSIINGEITSTTHSSWKEWIEPLNFQTRHPFAHTKCKKHEAPIKRWRDHMGEMKFDTAAQGVDYIILQHGRHTHHGMHFLYLYLCSFAPSRCALDDSIVLVSSANICNHCTVESDFICTNEDALCI